MSDESQSFCVTQTGRPVLWSCRCLDCLRPAFAQDQHVSNDLQGHMHVVAQHVICLGRVHVVLIALDESAALLVVEKHGRRARTSRIALTPSPRFASCWNSVYRFDGRKLKHCRMLGHVCLYYEKIIKV
jgi:hypothetical protein